VVFLKSAHEVRNSDFAQHAREQDVKGDRIAVSKREPVVDPALESSAQAARTMDVNSF
jgi:hypothetical protein